MAIVIDDTMEQASVALAKMDYLTCEQLCLDALAAARQAEQWAVYGRILLPLQEARRQRRMIASEGVVRLGTSDLEADFDAWVDQLAGRGCLAVTRPLDAAVAQAFSQETSTRRLHVEVLYVDSKVDDATWTVCSLAQPGLSADVDAPCDVWRDCWIQPDEAAPIYDEAQKCDRLPADWFLDACERLGDLAMRQVAADLPVVQQIEMLEARLTAAPDHEKLHQRLADAARRAAREHA